MTQKSITLGKYGGADSNKWNKVYNHNLNLTDLFWANQAELLSDVGDVPTDAKFSRLSNLNQYKNDNGVITYKIRYPEYDMDIIWEQSITLTSPNNTPDVKFNIINFPAGKDASQFGPLCVSSQPNSTVFDSCNFPTWYYAIGSRVALNNGIPALTPDEPNIVKHVELYVLNVDAKAIIFNESGNLNEINIQPGNGTSKNIAMIKVNDYIKMGSTNPDNQGVLTVTLDENLNPIANGEYTNYSSIAVIISNLTDTQSIIITSSKRMSSSSLLDSALNSRHAIQFPGNEALNNSRESLFYSAIIHGKHGVIKENLTMDVDENTHLAMDSINSFLNLGYGEVLFTGPWHDDSRTSYNGHFNFNNFIVNSTALLKSGTTGNISIICESDTEILSTTNLVFDDFIDMYQDKDIIVGKPIDTTKISFAVDENIELVGISAKQVSDTATNTDFSIGKNAFSANKFVQNVIPVSNMNLTTYNNFHNSPLNLCKTEYTQVPPAFDILLDGEESPSVDITNKIEAIWPKMATEFHPPLYISAWVKGEGAIQLKTNDVELVLKDVNDYNHTAKTTTLAISDNKPHWQLVEGFVFASDTEQSNAQEFISFVKEPAFTNENSANTIIAQSHGDFYFGATLTTNNKIIQFNNSEYITIPEIVIKENDSISLKVKLDELRDENILLSSNDVQNSHQLWVDSNGIVKCRIGDSNNMIIASKLGHDLIIDKWYSIRIEMFNNNKFKLFINNVSVTVDSSDGWDGVCTLNTIGSNFDDERLIGQLQNIDFNVIDDVRYYKLNDEFDTNPIINDSVSDKHGTAVNFTETSHVPSLDRFQENNLQDLSVNIINNSGSPIEYYGLTVARTSTLSNNNNDKISSIVNY